MLSRATRICLASLPDRKFTMNLISTVALALAMSTDAFAAAVVKGSTLQKPRLSEALRTGLIFGSIEGVTPIIGWFAGRAAAPYVVAWDHWIAFVLLSVIGLFMIKGGLSHSAEEEDKPQRHGFWVLAITAIATSIDAMVVGVGLALTGADIAVTAAAIAFATFVMVTIGVMLGRMVGTMAGKRAEVGGGIVLVIIGCIILYEHIGAVT